MSNRIFKPLFNPERLLFTNTIPGHTMLIRKSFFEHLDNWNEHFYYDWWLAMFASLNDTIEMVNMPLSWHRRHDESVIETMKKRFSETKVLKPTYQPYLYGLKNLIRLRKKSTWKWFYSAIINYDHSNKLVNEFAYLLLQTDIVSLFKLFFLCSRKCQLIYPNINNEKVTFITYFRGFFYPFIFSYNNCNFDL